MAHESAHVAQNVLAGSRVDVHRATIMRDVADFLPSLPSLPDVSVTDVLPASVLDAITSAVRSLPGYTLLSQVIGIDPLTGAAVEADRQAMLDELLSYGPFGAAVGAALQAVGALDAVADAVTENLGGTGSPSPGSRRTSTPRGRSSEHHQRDRRQRRDRRAVHRRHPRPTSGALSPISSSGSSPSSARRPLTSWSRCSRRPRSQPVWNLAKKVMHYDPLRGVDGRGRRRSRSSPTSCA